MSFRGNRHHGGYTLIETLAALAVSAILASVSAPKLNQFLGHQSAQLTISSLNSAVSLARAEALKRGEVVTVCARDPSPGDASAVCLPSGTRWDGGWMVYVDRGKRGRLDDDDLLLLVQQPLHASLKIDATVRNLSFQASGISLNAASHFDFMPFGKPEDSVRVCVNKPGRLRVVGVGRACAS